MTQYKQQHPNDLCVSEFDAALRGGVEAGSWLRLADVWRKSLSEKQRAAIAYASISRLDSDDAAEVFATAHPHADCPLPTLIAVMSDARWWASLASKNELKAYAVAIFEAMHIEDRIAFIAWATDTGRAAA